MKQDLNIAAEIEKTLTYLDALPKAKADAFFYTRLSAKFEKYSEPTIMRWFYEVPYFKPALFILFIAINISTMVMLAKTESTETTIVSATDTFIQEYELNTESDNYLVSNE